MTMGNANNYSIRIEGMSNPKIFIEKWAAVYSDKRENKYYTENIAKGLDNDEALRCLILWKNGTDEKLAKNKDKAYQGFKKMRPELKKLKDSNLSNVEKVLEFEKLVSPDENATIWKLFLLHIVNPYEYPIFDQHAYRSYIFFETGEIKELPVDKYKEIYSIYKQYAVWFNKLKTEHGLDPRTIDRALFSFGQILKKIETLNQTNLIAAKLVTILPGKI